MRYLLIYMLATVLLLVGCANSPAAHDAPLLKRLAQETEHTEPADIQIEPLLLEVKTVVVQADSAELFHTPVRIDEIAKYPCSTCHQADVDTSELVTQPHWDITLNHADLAVMTCTTCHKPENLDTLHTLTGEPVEFDHSYKVCAQCHNPQYKDWVGGAHGKRLEGWASPRVVVPCTSCHNPHDPAWGLRWPAVTGGGMQKEE